MSGFVRNLSRLLGTAFPTSGLQLHEPDDLSGNVQLVHPAIGPQARVATDRFEDTNSAVAAAVLMPFTTVPVDKVRHVEFLAASHNDPVARHIRIRHRSRNGQLTTVANTVFVGAGAAVAANGIFPLTAVMPRGIVLGFGEQLSVIADGLAAGQVLNVDAVWTEYASAELVPV